MIGSIIKLSILLFLFLYCLTHAELHNKNFIFPESGSEILAVDSSYDGSLAVATKDSIYIFSQPDAYSSTQGSLLGKISLSSFIKKSGLLEFKLLSKQQIIYCDTSSCRFCTSSHGSSSCSALNIVIKDEIPKQLLSVSASRAENTIFVRVVGANGHAAILSFEIQDTGSLNYTQNALDAPFIHNQVTVLGFSRRDHAFFVGSSRQAHEPFIKAKFGEKNISFVKISRVCIHDQTKLLESRIDLALACPEINYDLSFVVSAHYNAKLDQLLILFGETNGMKHNICKFDMNTVNAKIDGIWDTCQDINYMDASRDCDYPGPGNTLKEHCYYITHGADGYETTPCNKFGREADKFQNCELHRTTSTSYHYGWLESYLPFNGTLVARLNHSAQSYPWMLIPGGKADSETTAVFVSMSDGNILRLRLAKEMPISGYNPIVWNTTAKLSTQKSIALSSMGDVLYVTNQTAVATVDISCSDLYKTCDSVALGGWQDPLSCLWCPDEGKNLVISAQELNSCQNPLDTICPPIIDHANRDKNRSEWEIFGSNLDRMEDNIVYVCNRPCEINKQQSTSSKLTCFLRDGAEQDINCEILVKGTLGRHKHFALRANKVTDSVGKIPDTEASTNDGGNKSSSKVWKAIVAVIAVVLICVAIGVIIWFARKRMMANPSKHRDDNGSTMGLSPHTFLQNSVRRRSNSYVGAETIRMESINVYERLFNEIDESIKIDVESLRLESQIGKGHFGVVNRATYLASDGTATKVACKMIKDNVAGVREFIDEGLVMSNFNHPRLLRLIGISFTDEKYPIIITEYMVNGDLVTYLRNKENSPTLRTLLTFATQIAEGMEYLHSINFIHRDLAARNCMLDNMLQIKIADFGLCRQCNDDNMYEPIVKNRDLPLRWMSLEALEDEKFTIKGDVWAYGVVLWELMTRGMIPYGSTKGVFLLDFLRRGERLAIPPYCPLLLYEKVMFPCWNVIPEERPTFSELVISVEELINTMERSQNTQLYSHYERVSTTTPTATHSESSGFGNALR